MKLSNILLTGAILTTMLFSSCKKWLDVSVDGQSTSEELFEIGDGYRQALNGVYAELSTPTLYGRELQWGILDFFSNQYKIDVPETDLSSPLYLAAGKREYKHKDLLPVIDKIWLQAYKTIASANNIIKNISGEKANKFEKGKMEQDLILGEAKAVRAFIHFDMLRLFAPAPVLDDEQVYIPYVTAFPNTAAPHIKTREVLEKIIKDLEEARALVKPFDVSKLGQSAIVTGNARFYNELIFGMEGYSDKSKVDRFFLGRGYRLSYWAITALLSRVYQYNSFYIAEDLEKAKTYAEEVLNLEVADANKGKHAPFKNEDFNGFKFIDNPEQMSDIRMVSTLIFAGYNEKEQQAAGLDGFFPREKNFGRSNLFIVDKDGQNIFKTTEGTDEADKDIRAKRLLYTPQGAFNQSISTKWYVNKDRADNRNRTITILPLMRTTELRYILAEYYAEKGDFAQAYDIINKMREARALDTKLTQKSSKEEFLDDLVREAQREWISEGQLFFLYKRLDHKLIRRNGERKAFSKEESVLPIPAGESV